MTVVSRSQGDCAYCPIRERAVCARCETHELAELAGIKSHRSIAAGQTFAWAGEEMDFVGSIVNGVAALSQTMEDGRRQTVGLLMPSDFVGRPGRVHAAFDVTAITDVTLCCFRRQAFENMLLITPHLAHRLLEMTLDELDAAREWMLLLGRKTAREKIASLLVILMRRAPGPTPAVSFALPLSREAMAEYLGLTIETVSRQMTALRKAGIISLEGSRQVNVTDVAQLLRESGDDAEGIRSA